MTVDWTKPICFRDDPRPVRVLAADLKGKWAAVVSFLQADGEEGVLTVRPDGTYNGARDSMTIINVPESPKTRDVFVVIGLLGASYDSLKTAREHRAAYGPATIHQLRLVDDGAEHLLPDDEGSS